MGEPRKEPERRSLHREGRSREASPYPDSRQFEDPGAGGGADWSEAAVCLFTLPFPTPIRAALPFPIPPARSGIHLTMMLIHSTLTPYIRMYSWFLMRIGRLTAKYVNTLRAVSTPILRWC